MRINVRSVAPSQTATGEAVGTAGETCLWFSILADPANTGAQPTYGDAAANCLLPLDFTFPVVPNESYRLSEIFAKINASGDKAILVYVTKG